MFFRSNSPGPGAQTGPDSNSTAQYSAKRDLKLGYTKLEERRVLSASFAFDLLAADLTLGNFAGDGVDSDQVNISQAGGDYLFTLSDGVWTGLDQAGVTGDGLGTLTVDSSLVDRLSLVSTTSDQYDIVFGDFAFTGTIEVSGGGGFALFGDIAQTAGSSFEQTGLLQIDGVETVSLTNAGNDFDVVMVANAQSAELVDATGIEIDGAIVNSTTTVQADSILVSDSIETENLLLSSTNGVTQSANGELLATNLILDGTGLFELDVAMNDIDNIAGEIGGDLYFSDVDDINIASLSFGGSSIVGLSVSDSLGISTATGNGDIGQTASLRVGGAATLDAGEGDICLTDGDDDGNGDSENDLNLLNIVDADNAEVVDANDLTVVNADVLQQLWLAAGDADLDFADGLDGRLTLDGSVAAEQLLLQSSAGIEQLSGVVVAPQLMLGGDESREASGSVTLLESNNVQQVAATWNGTVQLRSTTGVEIASAQYDSVCDNPIGNPDTESISGVAIDEDLSLVVGGDLTQTAAASIAGSASLLASGVVCLTGADNTGDGLNDNDFGSVEAVGSTVELVDSNDIVVTGITASDNIFVRSGSNGVGEIRLGGNVSTSDADGSVLLQSNNGVNQLSGTISTDNLLLGGDNLDERTGVFDFSGNNLVSHLAVNLADNLSFAGSLETSLAGLTYSSACGTSESILVFEVAGDLTLDVDGHIVQSTTIFVGGNTIIDALGDVCLTNAANDFIGTVSAAGSTVELVDANDLRTGPVNATNDVYLRSGASATGELTLEGDLSATAANGQILLQSDSGITQASGVITTSQLIVGGDSAELGFGLVDLQSANQIDRLAVQQIGNFNLVNAIDLEIALLEYDSACGSSESICGLNVNGNLTLEIAGDLTQSAAAVVTGNTILDVTADICLTDGDCSGDGQNDNDFDSLTIINAASAEVVDINDLFVAAASVSDQLWLKAGDADAIVGDAVAGRLTLAGDVAAGERILLQASEGVRQTGGVITSQVLMLGGIEVADGSGLFEFTFQNRVDALAANLQGSLVLQSAGDLDVVDASFDSGCDLAGNPDSEFFNGIETAGQDVKLNVGGNLELQRQIDVSAGHLFLMVGGDANQSAAGVIAADTLGLMVEGDTVLSADNAVDVLAAQNNGTILFQEIDGFSVGVATAFAGTEFEMSVSGIESGGSDAKLVTNGDLFVNSSVDVGSGSLFVVVRGNVSQSPAGTIHASGLGLMVDGTTILDSANDVEVLAASVEDLLVFNDADDVSIGTVSVLPESEFSMTFSGVTSSNDDFKLITGSDVSINREIALGSGTAFVVSGGNIGQSSSGSITAANLGMIVEGMTRLEAGNDVDAIAAENNGSLIFNDLDDLTVSRVSIASGTACQMSVVGITTTSDDIKLITGSNLLIDDPIDVITGNVLLAVGGDLSQTENDPDGQAGSIQANGLALMVDGRTTLLANANRVQIFAAQNGASTEFANANDLTIGELIVDGMSVCGLDINGDLDLTVAGQLDQTSAVVVQGDTVLQVTGELCFAGSDCDGDGINANDFTGRVDATATSIEISDSNGLTAGRMFADNNIWLRSGDGGAGTMILTDNLSTQSDSGQILLQSDSGILQSQTSSVIVTQDLLLGSSTSSDARQGDFVLLGENRVTNIAAHLENDLEFTNRRDLNISPLNFFSTCSDFSESMQGLTVDSVTFSVTESGSTPGNLTDSADAHTVINSTARFSVQNDIVLGDGAATLQFTRQTIDQLINQNVSDAFVAISAAGNGANSDGSDIAATNNVMLFVDSSIILADVAVRDTLFVDTIEGITDGQSPSDILQTMISETEPSTIVAPTAAFVSGASIQLTHTVFDQLAIEANQQSSQLIMPFVINSSIGMTFTGSIDADVFTDPSAATHVNGGESPVAVPGVADVESRFRNDGFFAGNNAFVNPLRVGALVVNENSLDLVSFNSLGLGPTELQDVQHADRAATAVGDIYIETIGDSDINITADMEVTNIDSNLTIVAGNDVQLHDSSELRRTDSANRIGLVNTIQGGFASDQFLLVDPRSVIAVPGNAAFSDLNAQLDSAIGFQLFEFLFGNAGESSFNLIVGWFVDDVSASQAIDPVFQQSLLQQMDQITPDFLLSDFANFGQSVSAYSIRLDSMPIAAGSTLSLTNTSQFDQAFFAERSFLLSQIFLTNDSRINLFADGGSTDLNFTQEVLPTQTVVQNPDFIIVDTPRFEVPESIATQPSPVFNFVNLIQQPESEPITVEREPESYFQIRYTEDDDGIFEESFKWQDPNDDPDAIRAAIQAAELNDDDEFWPETDDDEEGGWFEKIKREEQVRPGLYFIFEVQEGNEIPEPVDAPVDRTDIENLLQRAEDDLSAAWPTFDAFANPAADNFQSHWVDIEIELGNVPQFMELDESPEASFALNETETHRFSAATQAAGIGSTLLLAQYVCSRGKKPTGSTADSHQSSLNENLFSVAARMWRGQQRRSSEAKKLQ